MADTVRPRLEIVATHPVQYCVPVFRGLASCDEWQTKVFLGCLHGVDGASFDPDFGLSFAWDCDLLGGYSHAVLSDGPLADLSGWRGVRAAPKALQTILAWQPDALLIFAYSPAFITALSSLLALRGVPIGSESYRHYRRLGVAPGQLETVLYAVDTSVIPQDPPAVTAPPPKATALRLGFVGKFTAVKDPLAIPRALALLPPATRERLRFEAAGDAPLLESCRRAMEAVLPGRCRFQGFLNQSQLPEFYHSIDLLILPSIQGEVWGLVVNEALGLGARALVSDRVSCRHDLVSDASAGWVFPAGDPAALAAALELALVAWPWPRTTRSVPHPQDLVNAVRRFRPLRWAK